MSGPWLTIIGVGDDGVAGLSPAASDLLRQARFVFGGARHLASVGELSATRFPWPSPLERAFEAILARRGEPVCVLASGDPFFFGVGSSLMRHLEPSEMICLPAPSAFSLAAARLGWAQQDCALVSLHGRPLARIIPHLAHGARILALSWDATTPRAVAELLCARGFAASQLTVCEHLGGPTERVRASSAKAFAFDDVRALNTIAVETIAGPLARIIPRAPGLPDDWFEHDGQITKRDVRAATLSALAPRRGEILWDIGAGSGSVGIEWMLADPANLTVAIEQDAARAGRVLRNAAALGTPDLRLVHGAAPEALQDLPTPDAIFVGGGATTPGVLDAAAAALRAGGRLVANAVTLETQAELSRRFAAAGGDLMQLQIARVDKIGRFHGFRPAMPVVQWSWSKPW